MTKLVPPAATAAGLPEGSVAALMAALPLGSAALAQVPGISTDIALAAAAAFQQSYVHGLRTTALSSLSFGILGIIGKLSLRLPYHIKLTCVRSMLLLRGHRQEDEQQDRDLPRE
jgi:hypothetical protein